MKPRRFFSEKRSGQNHIEINSDELIRETGLIPSKILLDISGEKISIEINRPFLFVIGPPGDFSTEEKDKFIRSGFIPVNINEFVLKVETAAFSITSILKYLIK